MKPQGCPFDFRNSCIWRDLLKMEIDSSQTRVIRHARPEAEGRLARKGVRRRTGRGAEKMGDAAMEAEARSGRTDAVAAHPLAELLECPPETGSLLSDSSECIGFDAGEVVFRQSEESLGLYVIVSGQFLRKTERMEARVTLGMVRSGDLVELAAVLGDGRHTYTLSAQTAGSVLRLPIEALRIAFQSYPPLRMRLLEELAREVSRAYIACRQSGVLKTRRRTAVVNAAPA